MIHRFAGQIRAPRGLIPFMCRRTARFALAGILVGALSLAGYALRPAPVLNLPTHIARDSLSEMDAAIYAAIFDAQQAGDHSTVATLTSQLEDPILLGHVLANRYLSSDYDSSREELLQWLAAYGDHPEAARVAALARRKGVEPEATQIISTTRPLKGDGYVFHLGRSTMPDSWYRGLRLWREGQYAAAVPAFRSVGDQSTLNGWQRSAGSYWAYRSLLQQGHREAAERELAKAAAEPLTFYGQLALARQGKSLPLRAEAPSVSSSLRRDPHVLRARAFSQLDMDDAAELELRSLYGKLDASERPGLITLAAEMGLANLQVRLAQQRHLTEGEQLFGSYPLPAAMMQAAQEMAPPALVLAVARHESGFRGEAGSEAGAVGMMQMLPSTARHVLRHLEVDVADSSNAIPIAKRLNDEVLSAKLGAGYLQMLTREPAIGQNLMKILAGYNAGPGAVANWNKSARHMNDPLLYLESIPYPETHNYVVQVMAHYWIYQSMLGQRPTSLTQLARGEWPTLS